MDRGVRVTLTSDEFISRFFGPPNVIWPDADPDNEVVKTIGPFLTALTKRGECPLVVPRSDSASVPAIIYVICWDTAHAGRVRSLLEAAVAHHWCPFDGRVAQLDPADSVEQSILEFVGQGTTFVLKPTRETESPTVRALQRLVSTLGGAPLRTPSAARPVGRMLREFDLALAAGATEGSLTLLKEIEGFGGISHENVAFLQIRRLAQLGRERELLTHGSLPTLVYTEPPRLVREAVLGAWARASVLPILESHGIDAAQAAIGDFDPDIAMLVDERMMATPDPDVATISALVALVRQDGALAQLICDHPGVESGVHARISALTIREEKAKADENTRPVSEFADLEPPAEAVFVPHPVPESWLEWVAQLGTADQVDLAAGAADDWEPAWSIDAGLAVAIDGIPELAVDDLLAGVSWFLETDDPETPASATARALIRHYLVAERFTPNDLGALCSLIQIFLRGAPSAVASREVLEEIRTFAPQWVSVSVATRVLDIADAVACGPIVDSAIRADFITTLLAPLNDQKWRLPVSLRRLAGLVGGDVGLDFDWIVEVDEAKSDTESGPELNPQILLYSLDTGTLARVQSAIEVQWPLARVSISATKVGNKSLKLQARGADIIVIATRRAAHAATCFISDNAKADAIVVYPDGSGSGSMMRVVESAVIDWVA